MQYHRLGNTDLIVSKICFGALGIGPLQANLPLQQGSEIIKHALEQGINFIDTAEMYQTYPYISVALKNFHKDVIISTKSYAYTAEMMRSSFDKARRALNRDYIDVFLLHEQENMYTIKGHREALEMLLELKSKKLIKAVGISTHHISGVKAALELPEIDIIHPLLNYTGLGIADGGREEMEQVVTTAVEMGKGVYTMKALGGGNLMLQVEQALKYAFSLPVHAVAIGMKSLDEVDYNIEFMQKGIVGENLKNKVISQSRKLMIESWCQRCGKCVERCSQESLTLTPNGIYVDEKTCLLCGYCASVCSDFCIKII